MNERRTGAAAFSPRTRPGDTERAIPKTRWATGSRARPGRGHHELRYDSNDKLTSATSGSLSESFAYPEREPHHGHRESAGRLVRPELRR